MVLGALHYGPERAKKEGAMTAFKAYTSEHAKSDFDRATDKVEDLWKEARDHLVRLLKEEKKP